ncbi:hypothetical protein [Massilia niabensis]|uniref:Uncharacterized protein n=1 Tax=Massilia niabensis TaxID=544910 RepID=A0ABW0L5N6_9BURK
MSSSKFSINLHGVAWALSAIISLLLVASMLGQISRLEFGRDSVYGLVQLFNVNLENNVPTFFSAFMLISSAVLAAIVGRSYKQNRKNDSRFWFVLAAGFLFLGYDEVFQVHEQLGPPMRVLLGGGDLGFLYFGWVVPGMIIVCVVALFFMRFLFRLPTQTRGWLLFSGCLYFGGCLGMEMVSGRYFELYRQDDLMYNILTTIEEGLEMTGAATLIYTLLKHISLSSTKIGFQIGGTELVLEPN